MTEPAKLPLTTPDLKAQQLEKLRQLFPEVFTEGGKLDFDRLRATLGDLVDDGPERFGLTWPGKRDCFRLIQEPSTGTLLPVEEESVNWDTTQNLFIEADNLEALKLLQKSYYGKVKMIYIDPPYNTGKDFIYPDRYAENLQTYLAYTGQASDEGFRFTTNPDTDGRFHSRWLNMMYPRLFLARNLLRDDGVIFVSIDDAEVHNLRAVMNEIFGEENFISETIIQSNKRGQTYKEIAKTHEYLIIYSKGDNSKIHELAKEKELNLEDSYGKFELWELRNRNPKFGKHNRPNLYYPIYVAPTLEDDLGLCKISLEKDDIFNVEVLPFNSEGVESCWRWSKDLVRKENSNELSPVVIAKSKRNGEWNIYEKARKNTTKVKSIWDESQVISEQGTVEMGELGMGKLFDHPKPLGVVGKILKISTGDSDLILDFFSGSSTTAHAVLNLNKEDGGNRRFILVQLPEPTDESSEAAKAGFHTIAEIGKERIRRVIARIEAEATDLEQKISAVQAKLAALSGEEAALKADQPKELFGEAKPSKELSKILAKQEKAQEELEQVQEQLANIRQCDLGFRVFRLGESNFRVWDGDLEKEDLGKQLEMALDYIRPERSEQDMLFELLIKSGFPLTTPVERLTLADKTVWSVAEGSMLVCLERPLTQEVIRAMAAKEPPRVVVLDAGFQDNDPLKTNAVQMMRSHGVEDFRTV